MNHSIQTPQEQTVETLVHSFSANARYQLIDMKMITLMTRMTNKWVYSLIQKQQFPKPIKLGRSSRWRLSDVEAWIDSKSQS